MKEKIEYDIKNEKKLLEKINIDEIHFENVKLIDLVEKYANEKKMLQNEIEKLVEKEIIWKN